MQKAAIEVTRALGGRARAPILHVGAQETHMRCVACEVRCAALNTSGGRASSHLSATVRCAMDIQGGAVATANADSPASSSTKSDSAAAYDGGAPPATSAGGAAGGDWGSGEIPTTARKAGDAMNVDWSSGDGPAAGAAAAAPRPGGGGGTAGHGSDAGAPGGAEGGASGAGGVARQLFHEAGSNAGEYEVLEADTTEAGRAWGDNSEAPKAAAAGGAEQGDHGAS